MLVIVEGDCGAGGLAVALDVDAVGAIDHYFGDGGIVEERLDRAEAEEFVDDGADEFGADGVGHVGILCAQCAWDFRFDGLARGGVFHGIAGGSGLFGELLDEAVPDFAQLFIGL